MRTPDRYIVSSPDDEKLWKGLAAEGIKIYNSELILTSALTQMVKWDNKAFLLS